MDSKKFQITRSLSVKVDRNASVILIGWVPPTALIIENPPIYLPKILEILSTPHTFQDVLQIVLSEYPEFSSREIEEVFCELFDNKIIQPPLDEGRYHRHQLYFNFFDINPEDYEKTLSTKKVGLIGSGGIGSTSALLLTTAGVGTIVLLDNDSLEESNLTRTILFEESDIATKKVESAKKRLEARNRNTTVIPIIKKCLGVESIKEYLSDCDIWLLSADTPFYKIQEWTSKASVDLGIPYISAGYLDVLGLVGPFFVPGITACYNCDLLNKQNNNSTYLELNNSFQAPSYGPLNTLVCSITVNEILRYLLGLNIKTLGTQLSIDSTTYQINSSFIERNEKCYCNSHFNI